MSSGLDIKLEPGIECVEEFLVTEEHTAKHLRSGAVRVLSTPSMILFMERTSHNCVQGLLPPGYSTVGIMVNIRHLNPAPVGATVRVTSRLVKVEGKRILFEVKATYRDLVIGEGVHERYIVSLEGFAEKLRRLLGSTV
jgi:predicted thioesterase